ncbi:hypothetical protein BDR03DRAFT_948544 [Suillus americanus]|nr:hypothetical protein BDR03DRAFT_948544 [Suillus americanus]
MPAHIPLFFPFDTHKSRLFYLVRGFGLFSFTRHSLRYCFVAFLFPRAVIAYGYGFPVMSYID